MKTKRRKIKRDNEKWITGIEKWVKKNCKGKLEDELLHHFIVAEIVLALMPKLKP